MQAVSSEEHIQLCETYLLTALISLCSFIFLAFCTHSCNWNCTWVPARGDIRGKGSSSAPLFLGWELSQSLRCWLGLLCELLHCHCALPRPGVGQMGKAKTDVDSLTPMTYGGPFSWHKAVLENFWVLTSLFLMLIHKVLCVFEFRPGNTRGKTKWEMQW